MVLKVSKYYPLPLINDYIRNIWRVPWLKTGFVVYTRLVLTWGFQVAIIECSSTKDVFLVDLFLGIKFKFIAKSCEDDGTQLKRIKFQNSLFSFSVKWVMEFLKQNYFKKQNSSSLLLLRDHP